ncbi:PPC domain-containing DNA-binding protein [Thermodesulfobacteriota bacterium]
MAEPFLARLKMDDDLLEAIAKEFERRSIRKGAFSVIGAVRKTVLGYYDSDKRQYFNRDFDFHSEIVSCQGNVSEKDGEIFVHAHLIIAGTDFQCYGGHLMPGTPIFLAELHGTPIPGEVPKRVFDDPTGLFAWEWK